MTVEAEEVKGGGWGEDSTQQKRDDREIMQMRVAYCTFCHEENVKRNDLNTH